MSASVVALPDGIVHRFQKLQRFQAGVQHLLKLAQFLVDTAHIGRGRGCLRHLAGSD